MKSKATFNIQIMFLKIATQSGRQELLP